MALSKITYNDKVALNPQPSVANENKCTDNDLNQIKEATNGVVDMVKSNNLLIDKCFINAYITNTGAISSANNNALFGYIEVEPNTTYTMSVNATINSIMIGEYDNTKTWVQRPLGNSVSKLTITTGASTKYVRVAINKDNASTMTQSIIDSLEPQFEKGGDRTTYLPYVNIYGQEIYSKGEVQIGEWYDGKPLYRKVISITTPGSTSNTQITTFDSTYNIQNYYGKVLIASSQQYLDINFYFSAEYNVATYVIQNTHAINMKVGSNAYTSQSGYIVLEYTKTTD